MPRLNAARFVVAIVVVASLIASVVTKAVPAKTCIECGHDAQGCAAADKTKSWQKLTGSINGSADGRSTYFYSNVPTPDHKDAGYNRLALLNNTGSRYGFKFQLENRGPPRRKDVSLWPDKKDQKVLWLIAVGPTQRYFYLDGFETCRGLWRHQKAEPLDGVEVFTYNL